MARDSAAEDWLIAIRAPNAGARRLFEAVAHHGSIQAVRAAARQRCAKLPEDAARYMRDPDEALLAQDLAWLEPDTNHLIPWGDAWYPSLLADTPGAPMVLFVVGDPAVLWQAQIAVVGSRGATRDGLRHAAELAGDLARQGVVITSGMARGIDAAAHQAALDNGGRTIAVLGTGPDRVYPAEHRQLARAIAAHGALVTEFPPGTTARPGHFPTRNRIISGLALGVLVVQAGQKSGSLITARQAAEQGREVMAVPGPIHLPQSRGCHQLIREGARLVDGAAQIMEDVRPLAARLADHLRQAIALEGAAAVPVEPANTAPAVDLSTLDATYQELLRALGEHPRAVDDIVETTNLTPEAVSSMLLILELQGLVICHTGGTWSRHHEIVL